MSKKNRIYIQNEPVETVIDYVHGYLWFGESEEHGEDCFGTLSMTENKAEIKKLRDWCNEILKNGE